MEDLISIIVPVYKVEKYLPECIESILKQTYSNLEIILVDDGSPDNSGKICDEYAEKDSRIKVIHKENGGVSSARNLGIEKSTGQYIAFIDADDYISNSYCEKILEKLKQENADCVACGYNRVYDNKIEEVISKEPYTLNNIKFLEKILFVQSGLGFCHMKLWKKSIIANIKFDEKLKVGEDAFFNMQASKNINKFYMLNEPLYNYRFNETSVVRNFDENYANKYLASMQIAQKYINENYKDNKEILNKINNYISYHVLLIVVNYCFNPENKLKTMQQIEKLKMICEIAEFKNAIKRSSYEGLSITRKITLITLKYKLYFFTMLIGKVRQMQFIKRRKQK